jgi:uncharacterized protein YaaR (DUF327 family)
VLFRKAESAVAIKKIGDREGHYSFGRLRSLSFGKSGKMSVQVEESIARIVEQGQELCEAPTYSGLKSYREVIREVVGMYISQKYTHCERTEWSAFGKKNIYEALRKMDKILSELSEDIRTGKVAHSRITERQDRLYEQLEKVFR